jgi:lipid-A-disaccharide synthase
MSSPVRPLRIGIVAGEASGDQLGSHLMRAAETSFPGATFFGIGGPKMQGLGMDVWFPMEKLAVRGFVEVLKHYREIVGIRRKPARDCSQPSQTFSSTSTRRRSTWIWTDLKRQHPTLHYVCPQFWAWTGDGSPPFSAQCRGSLRSFHSRCRCWTKRDCRHLRRPSARGSAARQPDRDAMREQMRLPKQGSYRHAPRQSPVGVKAMGSLFVRRPAPSWSRSPTRTSSCRWWPGDPRPVRNRALPDAPDGVPLTMLYGHAHDAMVAADAVLVASGTASLEAALLKRPMVITYKLPSLTYWIAKRRIYLPYVGLPNVLAGEFIVPELIQDDATPGTGGGHGAHPGRRGGVGYWTLGSSRCRPQTGYGGAGGRGDVDRAGERPPARPPSAWEGT